MQMSKYDIVVFGATGYAGKYVVEHLANSKSKIEGLTWCVAGRSAAKLAEMLREVGSWVNRDLSNVERILADTGDEDSLNNMCKRANVLINCVGPYSLYGEPVVRAAVNNKCHHLDLSGEEFYLKSTAVNYDKPAKDAQVYIVGACGFDSAICDMGIEFLTQNSPYLLNGVSCYVIPHMPNIEVNYGTWHSIVNAVQDFTRMRPLDRILFSKPLPRHRYKLAQKPISYKAGDLFNRWTLRVPAGDRRIALSTQYYRYAVENKRPIQVENYFCAERTIQVFGTAGIGISLVLLSFFSWGRGLLLKYPSFFTYGTFHTDGPTRDTLLDRSFETIFEGEAFDAPNDYSLDKEEPRGPPTKRVSCRVIGPDPAYITCASCLVQGAVTLLKEREKLPGGVNGGGVFTPAAVFGKTSYIDRLQMHDIKFELLQHS